MPLTPIHANGSREPVTDPVLRLVGLRKSFGTQTVLDDISLDFHPRQTTVIMGPSGCGKSVLLKHVVGLLRPDEGEVWYNGHRIDQLSEEELGPVRLEIGLLFQMGALFDSMTVQENIEFPMIEHTKLTREQRAARVAEALDLVDLAGVQPKLPSQLSGGQRKRVALARAIVLHPRMVLYDEPTTGLDPIRSAGIDELISRMEESLGVTNIVVTHDLASAKRVADRVVMLLGGKVAADGTFDDLLQSPDRRVQHFLAGIYDKNDETHLPEATRSRAGYEPQPGKRPRRALPAPGQSSLDAPPTDHP
jgi:phospholipid/cholesterol/gamma-HCH transport system ATP-binding protein